MSVTNGIATRRVRGAYLVSPRARPVLSVAHLAVTIPTITSLLIPTPPNVVVVARA